MNRDAAIRSLGRLHDAQNEFDAGRVFDEIWSAQSDVPSNPTPRSDREVPKEVS
jgi:hypothetical protein